MKTYKDFSDFDIFGYNVGLYFNGNIKEGTLFGMISTIIYFLTFIIFTIYYTTQVIRRENITFSTSTFKHENATTIKLKKEIFALNFALEDPINYTEFIDETIYYIKADHITAIRDPKTQGFIWYYEEIKTGPCSLDMFEKDSQRFFKDSYQNNYCLYGINNKNLTGHFVFDHYSKIRIAFYPCVNSTENNNHCKPKNIIDYYLNNTYASMLLQSITIDENKIPMTKIYIENPFTIVSQNIFTNYQIFLKIVETEDDIGLFANSKKYKRILQFDYTTNLFSLNRKISDVDSFCEFVIKLSDKKTVYNRKFEKIYNAFSKAGSIMTLIFTVTQFCSWLSVKIVYEVNVINKVFKFDLNTTTNKKIDENNISKHIINFHSENLIQRNRSNNEINIGNIKNENEENITEINKENNFNLIIPKNKSNTKLNQLNVKTNLFNNQKNKRVEDNSGNMLINNNILQNRSININQTPNISKRYSENNIYNWRQRKRKSADSEKSLENNIKFNCYQLLCYYPIRYFSNNVNINLAKSAQNFFRKTMDIVSIFQNVVTSQKIFKLMAKNQRLFSIYDEEFSNHHKPIINNNRIEDYTNNL